MISKSLQLVFEGEIEKLWLYKPSVLRPFDDRFEPMSFGRRLRYLYEFCQKGRFQVYYYEYLGEIIGRCVVTPGGRRIPGTTTSDIVIGGPYYIIPEMRGKGLAKRLLQLTLEHCQYEYLCAYDYIKKTNIPSVKVSESVGFVKLKEMNVVGLFHWFEDAERGSFWLLRYDKKQME